MRASSLVALLAVFGLTTVTATAQTRSLQTDRPAGVQLQRLQLQSERPSARQRTADLTVVSRSRPGEVRLITLERPSERRRGRLADRYRGVHANRTRPVRLRSAATATPALRTIRAPEGTYVRRNGSYFRVVPRD